VQFHQCLGDGQAQARAALRRDEELSSCWNFWKSLARFSGAMPSPWSATPTMTACSEAMAVTVTAELGGANFTALASRLTSACTMRSGSTSTGGRMAGSLASMATWAARAVALDDLDRLAHQVGHLARLRVEVRWPDSIFEMSRMSLMMRTRRSQLLSRNLQQLLVLGVGTDPGSSSTSCTEPRMEVSGVRNSWLTIDTNSS